MALLTVSKAIGIVVILAPIAIGCRANETQESSAAESVHIPQSAGEDQGHTEFCWDYAISAYLESEYIVAHPDQPQIKLSEAYVGFYHVLKQLNDAISTQNLGQIDLTSLTERSTYVDALALFEASGVVPESEFDHPALRIVDKAKPFFSEKFADAAKLAAYKADPELLRSDLAAAVGVKLPPKPAQKMLTQSLSPLGYLHSAFGYEAAKYQKISLYTEGKPAIVKAIRASLLQGHSVIGAIFGHGILIVDFVTEGGHAGAMTPAELAQIADQPIKQLVVKNSAVGFYTPVNQEGSGAVFGEDSHYDVLSVDDIVQVIARKDLLQ